jgi:molybdopterin-guanine dinucleotide biosynthesis protein A
VTPAVSLAGPATAAVILAGGHATRLGGQPKGLLTIGGKRIIDRQLAALHGLFSRILLATNDPAPFADLGLEIVADRTPGAGPLAALDAALAALTPHESALVAIAGDMPFITPASLTHLRDHAPHAQAVVPRTLEGVHPLFARYSRTCAPPIARALADARLKTQAILTELDVTYLDEPSLRAIDPALTFLTNINTPDDLAHARATDETP